MIKTFALLITINGQVYVQDTGMSGADCVAEAVKVHSLYYHSASEMRSAKGGVYSCEVEGAVDRGLSNKW